MPQPFTTFHALDIFELTNLLSCSLPFADQSSAKSNNRVTFSIGMQTPTGAMYYENIERCRFGGARFLDRCQRVLSRRGRGLTIFVFGLRSSVTELLPF